MKFVDWGIVSEEWGEGEDLNAYKIDAISKDENPEIVAIFQVGCESGGSYEFSLDVSVTDASDNVIFQWATQISDESPQCTNPAHNEAEFTARVVATPQGSNWDVETHTVTISLADHQIGEEVDTIFTFDVTE